MRISLCVAILSALGVGVALAAPEPAKVAPRFDSATISGLGARNIGSAAMSGRVAAVAGVVEENGKVKIFIGAASGGVWRSEDGGTTFKPVFDRPARIEGAQGTVQPAQSIGAVAIDPSNSKTIWVGTGESWTRNSVSVGNGIYKSTDNGETWTMMGLPNSERISKIIVHPKDGNVVYACVPGRLWSDSADRGLYRTSDGGKSWSLILKGPNLSTGCGSIAMDPRDPNALFATLWDFRRKGWTFRSGGPTADAVSGSGMFRSSDGGAHWTEVTEGSNKGFPRKPYGRIAVAIAPSKPDVVYAVVEGVDSALFRSDDGGKTWEKRDKSQMMVWRPFYFSNLIVDPSNPDKLFKPDLQLIVSEDGGKSFSGSGGGMHGDWHDVWINPERPMMVVGGNDGGFGVSYDGGNRWTMAMNLPISQFYHVSLDDKDPYQVYGGLQDNSSWVGDSSYPGGVTNSRWENLYGGDGFWMFADPADPDYVYAEAQGGEIGRVHRLTHEIRSIKPTAGYKEKLRFNWNTPIHLSPNEKGTIYIGAQFLFRSRDHGSTWERISGDLTTNDKEKQRQEESGGITVDNSAAEMHTTIYSISESPKSGSTIWVGTDDGNVQLTRDGGKTWSNVGANLPKKEVPAGSWVSWVEASRHDAATAYAAIDRHTFGDFDPYVYVTHDYGKSWKRIVTPQRRNAAGELEGVLGYAHVIREDAVKADLLYLGTESGLWISNDGGAHWAGFKGGNFPAVAVRDIALQNRDSDLVLATHGRGIWIIDDVTPLRKLTQELAGKDAAFIEARPAQQRINSFGGWSDGDAVFTGDNAPGNLQITYFQPPRHLFGDLKLEILDADGKVVETLPASKHRGINRVGWSMRVKPPKVPPAAQVAGSATQGPRVVPGVFTVRMTKGKSVLESKVEIGLDRRVKFSVADRKAQFDAAMRVHALFGRMSDLAFKVNAVREGATQRAAALKDKGNEPLRKQLLALSDKADVVRKEIVATKEGGAITGEERLREHTDNLYGSIMSYEGRPAAYLIERTEVLERELGDVEAKFKTLADGDLAAANAKLEAAKLPPLMVPGAAPPSNGGGRKEEGKEEEEGRFWFERD
jgi:photosystem II stability/assembly factor-like uncharacterized protein